MKKLNFLISFILVFTLLSFSLVANAQYIYETVYSESFGDVTGNTAIDAHTDYDVTTVQYSASTTSINLRKTSPSVVNGVEQYPYASGEALVFMNVEGYFQIEGINTMNYEQLQLSFGMRKDAIAAHADSTLVIEYSTDLSTWSPVEMTYWTRAKDTTEGTMDLFPTGTGTVDWYYITCDANANTFPATSSLNLRFNRTNFSNQLRIDDIKISGQRPVPYVQINVPEDGAVYSPCDSLQLDLRIENFNFYMPYPVPLGDGLLKVESDLLPYLIEGVPNTVYIDAIMATALGQVGKFTLPEGNYSFIVTLTDIDSIPLLPLASDTSYFTVAMEEVENPTFSVPAGTYNTTQYVELSTTTEDAIIYYTTDGTDPDENSPVYTDEIEVAEDMTIKAFAVKECAIPSEIVEADYVIDENVGINNYANNGVSITPNPATSSIYVSGIGFEKMEIVNFIGQVVYQKNIVNEVTQVDISNLNAGVYFVRMIGDTTVTKKFIKK